MGTMNWDPGMGKTFKISSRNWTGSKKDKIPIMPDCPTATIFPPTFVPRWKKTCQFGLVMCRAIVWLGSRRIKSETWTKSVNAMKKNMAGSKILRKN